MFLMFIFPGSVRGGRVGLDRSVTAMVPSRHHQPASLSLLQPGHGTRVSPQPSSARLDLKTAAATTAGTRRRRRRGPDTSCSTGERMTRSRNVGLSLSFLQWLGVGEEVECCAAVLENQASSAPCCSSTGTQITGCWLAEQQSVSPPFQPSLSSQQHILNNLQTTF